MPEIPNLNHIPAPIHQPGPPVLPNTAIITTTSNRTPAMAIYPVRPLVDREVLWTITRHQIPIMVIHHTHDQRQLRTLDQPDLSILQAISRVPAALLHPHQGIRRHHHPTTHHTSHLRSLIRRATSTYGHHLTCLIPNLLATHLTICRPTHHTRVHLSGVQASPAIQAEVHTQATLDLTATLVSTTRRTIRKSLPAIVT